MPNRNDLNRPIDSQTTKHPSSPAVAQSRGPVIVSISDLTLSPQDRARLLHPLTGGVVLFARNFSSRAQVRRLCSEIRALRSPRLLVTVDHEGGRVQRFRKGFTAIPSMGELGESWRRDPLAAVREATRYGVTIARELLAVGVDLSFTPVLDLDYGHSDVIGKRAFDSDPRVVALLARSLCHGLLLGGMANCGKHFPGHGFAHADSHVAMPVDTRGRDALMHADMLPYAHLGEALLAVMPAHVIYPEVDTAPAGFSRIWLKDVLRGQLGYRGVIVSDDLTMAAAGVAGDITQRTRAALRAGCDLVLVCQEAQADQVLATLAWKRPRGFDARVATLFRVAGGDAPVVRLR